MVCEGWLIFLTLKLGRFWVLEGWQRWLQRITTTSQLSSHCALLECWQWCDFVSISFFVKRKSLCPCLGLGGWSRQNWADFPAYKRPGISAIQIKSFWPHVRSQDWGWRLPAYMTPDWMWYVWPALSRIRPRTVFELDRVRIREVICIKYAIGVIDTLFELERDTIRGVRIRGGMDSKAWRNESMNESMRKDVLKTISSEKIEPINEHTQPGRFSTSVMGGHFDVSVCYWIKICNFIIYFFKKTGKILENFILKTSKIIT